VVSVADGDTIAARHLETGKEERICFCGIDAPEIAHGNKPGQPEEEILVNDELVKVGLVYHYGRYSDLCPNGGDDYAEAEKLAKVKRLGVWRSGEQQKPWDYRKAHR
jgi:endonuclease YncB( thermonuclease family)